MLNQVCIPTVIGGGRHTVFSLIVTPTKDLITTPFQLLLVISFALLLLIY